jgi:hypothetical protein
MNPARLDVAWTVAASACGAGQRFASAVLRLEAEWREGAIEARCRATLDRAGNISTVNLPDDVTVHVAGRAAWVHLELRTGTEVLLRASFERGKLAYCTSALPGRAGLAGGTYDPPTAILELYRLAAA